MMRRRAPPVRQAGTGNHPATTVRPASALSAWAWSLGGQGTIGPLGMCVWGRHRSGLL